MRLSDPHFASILTREISKAYRADVESRIAAGGLHPDWRKVAEKFVDGPAVKATALAIFAARISAAATA